MEVLMIDDAVPVPPTNVESCLAGLRRMILRGELLPGEKLHQHDLAERLAVSRIPLREALAALAAEGVLTHRRNSGYQVARFTSAELSELYLMRRLLETELLRTAVLGPSLATAMAALNEELRGVDPQAQMDHYHELNQAFHFVVFDTSPLKLVRGEVARLWYRSSIYRSFFLRESAAAARVQDDHEQMIQAVAAGDTQALIAISDAHRRSTEENLTGRLA